MKKSNRTTTFTVKCGCGHPAVFKPYKNSFKSSRLSKIILQAKVETCYDCFDRGLHFPVPSLLNI